MKSCDHIEDYSQHGECVPKSLVIWIKPESQKQKGLSEAYHQSQDIPSPSFSPPPSLSRLSSWVSVTNDSISWLRETEFQSGCDRLAIFTGSFFIWELSWAPWKISRSERRLGELFETAQCVRMCVCVKGERRVVLLAANINIFSYQDYIYREAALEGGGEKKRENGDRRGKRKKSGGKTYWWTRVTANILARNVILRGFWPGIKHFL